MTQQYCDIENQCQHFCVYKQMVCPVYIRVSHSNATERDKVLDELIEWLDEQVPKKDLEHPFYECKTRIKKKMVSLRIAAKDGE